MTTSKKDASEAAQLMHNKNPKVRSVAASDLAQAKRRRKGGRKSGRKSGR